MEPSFTSAKDLQVMTEQGSTPGVIGSIPPHLLSDSQRSKPMEIKNMLIDIGADSKDDAKQIGIKPGQQIVPICPFTPMANKKFLRRLGITAMVVVLQLNC